MAEEQADRKRRGFASGPTARRRRQVWWARRLRRIGLAWQNALEIARAGRLTAPYGAPFEVLHEERVYRLRRYQQLAEPGVPPVGAPLLLVPPLMVASEVYDISPDVSAVAYLQRAGVDVWLTDFGAPEREEGGMERTLDDHVRAVAEAVDRVRAATGRDVHLAGYSQGGMFCYQAAAFRRSAGLASVITMGSPVDLHRTVELGEDTTERLVAGLRAALAWPLGRIEGLPGFFTSTGFKLLSARKEATQLLDFVHNLHDRKALEKREAKRLFLGGQGFVAWPGPAFRKFVDELIVGNRMQSGGFVIDGHSVTLADIACPILYFVGSRDEMGRPAAVRGIRRATPRVDTMYEIPLKAGHFGLVVGSTALTITWPSVVAWMRWREGAGPVPAAAFDVRADDVSDPFKRPRAAPAAEADDDDGDGDEPEDTLELARELVEKTAKALVDRVGELSEDLGSYLDNARWQLPRLARLRGITDDTLVSCGRSLSDQAERIGDRTFFLWRGRAFTYAEANRRVDAVVRGLIACGMRPGDKVGVMMVSRPSHLTIVTALNRLGAVSVLLSPDTPDGVIASALALGDADRLIVDPDSAARCKASLEAAHRSDVKLFVLGGVGEVPFAPGAPRVLPPGVVDMEKIDPETVTPPSWYKPDPGRASDLAMVFVSSGRHEPARAMRITNRRWAFSALGAAAAATLTTRDTVYCCLPLHHPSGTLVATGSALAGGARLALASRFEAATFWDEVRRYGASVVYYAGDMCRYLVDAPPALGESNNPVRLFAGSGMRRDVWRRLVERFGPVGVLEMYASTEANTVLANASGKKLGSVGRPLPGSPDVAIAAWDFAADDFLRDGSGRLVHARLDEPGMLVARLSSRAGSDVAQIDPRRLLRDAFEPGDLWFVTGDLFEADVEGDYRFFDRHGQVLRARVGDVVRPVSSTRIEDAIYEAPNIGRCIATVTGDHAPVAAIQLARPGQLDLAALSAAVAALPEYARPQRIRIVEEIPLTDGFRAIKRAGRELEAYAWDARAQRYVPAPAAAAATLAAAP
ncbi:MAG: alpha/beta fold hydrolase [Deltaproteobacteria bacterium]|nr:alpha/beta fold hydrolase [Deltaproteobacteria bacterium]